MAITIPIQTKKKEEFISITTDIQKCIRTQAWKNGIVHIFIPHTTAAVTINENADPDVVTDMLSGLNRMVPTTGFHHAEGNSPAHIKSSLIGASLTVSIENGSLVLGTWQGIYFCEFDGPRQRKVLVSFIPS